MDSHNPYAPSRASLSAGTTKASSVGEANVWRDGKTLVCLQGASLPPRCVKCNAPADLPTKERTLYWMHPAIYVLWLVNFLVLLIVYLIVRKKAEIDPGLCEAHKRRRVGAIAYGWLGFFGGILLAAVGGSADSPLVLVLGVLVTISSIVVAFAWGRLVYPKKITIDEVRLGGICADYLDSLPQYPARRAPRSGRRA